MKVFQLINWIIYRSNHQISSLRFWAREDILHFAICGSIFVEKVKLKNIIINIIKAFTPGATVEQRHH